MDDMNVELDSRHRIWRRSLSQPLEGAKQISCMFHKVNSLKPHASPVQPDNYTVHVSSQILVSLVSILRSLNQRCAEVRLSYHTIYRSVKPGCAAYQLCVHQSQAPDASSETSKQVTTKIEPSPSVK